MCHSYSHLQHSTTVFRSLLFMDHGVVLTWLYLNLQKQHRWYPIDIYNHGKMKRDFTYIDDHKRYKNTNDVNPINAEINFKDSKSPVAPFRIVNIGNSQPQNLMDFIKEIEFALGMTAIKIFYQCKQEMYKLLGQVTSFY